MNKLYDEHDDQDLEFKQKKRTHNHIYEKIHLILLESIKFNMLSIMFT